MSFLYWFVYLYVYITLVFKQDSDTLRMLFVDSHMQCTTSAIVQCINLSTFLE